jgi:dolichol-phosphate mannosyltransferase
VVSSPDKIKLLVLVCTYNELSNLPRLIDEIGEQLPSAKILVIDDGSPDGTGQWLEKASQEKPFLDFIQRGKKLGLGTAIRAGLDYAIQQKYDWVFNLDADFSHDPTALPSLVKSAIESQADLLIGSRYVSGGGLKNCSWRRHFVSRAANLCARTMVGWKIRDCSSAYRGYRVPFLKQLDLQALECDGYGFLEEILWAILRQGGKVVERPIIYTEREHGVSKISLKEALGTWKVLVRLSKRRL